MGEPDEKWIYVSDIVGFTDIADRLNTNRHRVVMWYHRRDATKFPEAITRINDSFVFDMQEVEVWYELWISTRRWLKDA
jgi:hypothetical protein